MTGASQLSARKPGFWTRCRFAVGALVAAVLYFVCEELPAADSVRRVDVRVTSIAGPNLYIDHGREAGLEPGDIVTLTVPGQGVARVRIDSVSRTSARCTVPGGGNLFIDVGTPGSVIVPEERFAVPSAGAPPATERVVPEHPPWLQELDAFETDQPLLVPPIVRAREDRPTEIHGRIYGQYLHNINLYYGDNQYSIARTGVELWIENPFHEGGGIHFDGGAYLRGYNIWDGSDDLALQAWPTGLSYYWGGTEDQPLRFEVGRFFHSEFAEFGLIDGTEFVYRTSRGHRVGFSFGFLPAPFPYPSTGEDLAASVFYRFVSEETEQLQAGVGFQHTWHNGTPDRDLLIGTLGWYPSSKLSLNGSVWADFYTSSDTVKTVPVELTEGFLNATYRVDSTWGFGGNVNYFRWPETLRKIYRPISDVYILRNQVLRVGLRGWKSLGEHVRFDVRVDQWFDQDDEGTAWDVAMTLSDWPLDQYQLILGVYDTDGLYSSGPGGRISLMRFFSRGFVSIGYDTGGFLYNPSNLLFLQQSVHAALDLTLTPTTSISLTGDYRFGNRQEALTGGVYLQKRF